MTDVNSSPPPAGWYPDPAGSSRTRWWNGFGWSDTYGEPVAPAASLAPAAPTAPGALDYTTQPNHVAPPVYGNATTFGAAPAYGAAAAYGNAPVYAGAPAYGTAELKAPEGTSPYTLFIWILALLPVIGLIDGIYTALTIDQVAAEALDPNAPPFTPRTLISGALGWIVVGLTVTFGILDWRALKKAAVPNPFHWAWIFFSIIGAPVYMVGRSIIVRRRVGSGLAPMIVNLILVVATFVLSIVGAVLTIGSMLDSGLLT